jgi:hypothetical protein
MRQKLAGHGPGAQSEEIFDLGGGDEDCDAVGEPDDDRTGNEAHGCAEAGEAHDDQHDSGHQCDKR